MDNENRSKIEAFLFASGEPVSVQKIAKFLKISAKDCEQAAKELAFERASELRDQIKALKKLIVFEL